MEECGKRSIQNYRIPKKVLTITDGQSDDIYIQSPLSRLPEADQWEHRLQGWTSRSINNNNASWRRKRQHEKSYPNDETSTNKYGRQPKVLLTNVLKTELGRKYVKAQLITDANLSHGLTLQSDQQTSSSVGSVEIWELLNPLHENLLISERQPKVILTNVLRTETGRQFLNDLNISDEHKLQSNDQLSSSIANLESCQKLCYQQSCLLPKRCEKYNRRSKDWRSQKDAETNNLQTVRKCDVLLEDCILKNKEDRSEKRRKESICQSPNLKEACVQISESRNECCDVLQSHQDSSPQKSLLPNKEEMKGLSQSPVYRDLNKSYRDSPWPENDHQNDVEPGCSEQFSPVDQETVPSCPRENCSKSSSKRKELGDTSKENKMSPQVVAGKQQADGTLSPEKKLGKPARSKKTAGSADPIVLSSDEEERNVKAEDPDNYSETEKDHELENNEKEQESELPVSEDLTHSVTESKTEQVSEELFNSTADDSSFREQLGLTLDLKFEMLYIGKYKGTATDCARFTTRCITIPFEVAHNKTIELSVDTMHLRRFGQWTNNAAAATSMNGPIIFLWLSSDYVEQIESTIGGSVMNRKVKNTEFVYIKLPRPLGEEEQVLLNEIIEEISKENPAPGLVDPILWEDALEEITCEEDSSFISSCYELFQQQKDNVSCPKDTASQVSMAMIPKSRYTLLQMQSNGQYSFSIISTNHNEWKEWHSAGPVQNLIIYPTAPAKGGLGITREDLECLEYGEFLNDVIIDFYLKYLLLEKAPKELAERSHIFSSFFYKCLTRTEKNSEENPNLSLAQRRHERVKRWTRHINIFNKDYIFVPVNEESHWYIAVICFPWLEDVVYEESTDKQSSLQQSSLRQFPHQPEINENARTESVLVFMDIQNDKEKSDVQPNGNVQALTGSPELDSCSSKSTSHIPISRKKCKRPCILIFDSLKASSAQNTVQILREYLEAEWEAKWKTDRKFDKSSMVDFCPRVPKQNNSSDCGLYLLQYVEAFFQRPIVSFELPIHLERWFPRRVVRRKREEIRDLILQLYLRQQSGSKS